MLKHTVRRIVTLARARARATSVSMPTPRDNIGALYLTRAGRFVLISCHTRNATIAGMLRDVSTCALIRNSHRILVQNIAEDTQYIHAKSDRQCLWACFSVYCSLQQSKSYASTAVKTY